MALAPFTLLDPETIGGLIEDWSARQPEFGALLRAGIAPAPALSRWGLRLLRANRFDEAGEAFRAVASLTPADPVAWLNCGLALDRHNRFAEAAACLDRSVALSPRQTETWILLGTVRMKLKDLTAAETAYRVALEQAPSSPLAWQCLGLLQQDRTDCDGAIESFKRCIKCGGSNPALLANLGKIYSQSGRFAEALESLTAAVNAEPDNHRYRQMMRKARFLTEIIAGRAVDEAIAGFQSASASAPGAWEKELQLLLQSAFGLLSQFGHVEAARLVGRRRRELWPESACAEYLLRALAAEPGLARSPDRYLIEHFDEFAGAFDQQLVNVLGYDVPEKIGAAVRAATAPGQLYDALDAGCGTGLCGPHLRHLARKLVGVDLAAKMLERAAERKLYDALHRAEIMAYLAGSPGEFDLITAADVLIYIGDLGPLFAAAAVALRRDGLIAVSTERWAGEGFHLNPSGRFSHSPGYVQAVATPDFAPVAASETTLRLEANLRVPGNLFVFRRRA